MIEQPDTVIPDFFIQPTQRFGTSQLGDVDDKTINLFERCRMRLLMTQARGGVSKHGLLSDFADSDARDRWRSSWERFPNTTRCVVNAEFNLADDSPQPNFAEECERFAVE